MATGFGYTAGPPGSSGGLTRPASQPAPTQPGFGTQSQFTGFSQAPGTSGGLTTAPQPPAGGLGALQQFNQQSSFGGFTPQFGGFGQNPQMQQYRQQLDAWRGQRPDFAPGMDHDMRHQQMEAWRDQRPDRPNMQQQGTAPGVSVMPGYSPYMPQILANAQGAQGAPQAQIGMAAPDGISQQQQQQQAALLSQYNQMLQGSGQPGVLANPATLTPQQIQSMQGALGLFAGAGAGTPSAPTQAVMPPAPNTQQIGREDPRMQAMRNMQRMRPGFGG